MHAMPELGAGVPAFLAKLWKLVEDPETDDLICWSPSGKSFFIRNQAQFARELLPHYYKHNNMASFVRQLNMYGFHKKVSVELGGLKYDKDEMEFAHQFFCKGHPYSVEHIKRKIASTKGQDPAHPSIKPELMNKMLSEVRNMRGRQDHLDSRLGTMKHENEALWRELALLRQKHLKQQQIVNKLIHFLITLVQPARGGGLPVKRRYPLMIDSSRPRKETKLSKPQTSPTGPVIHELDASESDTYPEYIVAEILENRAPAVQSPEHTEVPIDDDDTDTIHLIKDPAQFEDDTGMINSHEMNARKKLVCKDKKKEELHLLEMPANKTPVAIALRKNESANSKAIPAATVHSSKLAAMAANIDKSEEVETDMDMESPVDDVEYDALDNDASTLVKLQDMLIVPEIIDYDKIQDMKNKENNSKLNKVDKELNQYDGGKWKGSNDEWCDANEMSETLYGEEDNCNRASTSSSKDLSLSCVNPSGVSEATYRLGPMQEMDNHLETMQTELDNLRDILRGEGYSIDANTLFGLFGADDPMTFGLPINPELNPNCEKEDDDHIAIPDSINGSAGGELIAYNPASNLYDFDDILLENASSSLSTPVPTELDNLNDTNPVYHSDPLLLDDSKASLLDSLVKNDVNSRS